jgi:hypothetical protein
MLQKYPRARKKQWWQCQGRRQLGRRSGGREQEPHVLHDPVKMLLDKKRRVRDMITPEKEKIVAKKHFTDGIRRQ